MEVFDLLYLMLLPSVFLLTLCGLYGAKDLLRQKEKAPTKCQSQRLNQIKNGKVAQPTKATNFSAKTVD